MSRLGVVLEETQRVERTAAIRLLLRKPLVLAALEPEGFAGIVRHRSFLATWFGDNPGWKLVVEQAGGFARLHKVPAAPDPTRGASLPAKEPFDRRRYCLFCLALAALDDVGSQTTLARLAEAVGELCAGEDGIVPFDGTALAERRAFVDALRLLVLLGVLRVRDGDAEQYARSSEGDVLYDVNDRLLGQLVAAPVPPAWAKDAAGILAEHLPDTPEGNNLRSRQHVIRRLLEDPALFYDELDPAQYAWLDHSRGFLYRLLGEVGLPVERRKEGLAPVDPEGEVTDERFPDGGSTAKHAALLLATALVARHRQGRDELPETDAVELVAGLQADYGATCGWSKAYPPTAEGAAHLSADALGILEAFRLVTRRDTGRFVIRPAIARFAAAPATPARRGR